MAWDDKQFRKRAPFASRKGTFCNAICHLLEAERRHIANILTVNGLQKDENKSRRKLSAVLPPAACQCH